MMLGGVMYLKLLYYVHAYYMASTRNGSIMQRVILITHILIHTFFDCLKFIFDSSNHVDLYSELLGN
jgi:hypothetical protein